MAMLLRLVAILGVAWVLVSCGSSASQSSIPASGGNASVGSADGGGLDANGGTTGASSGGGSSAYPSGGGTGGGGDSGTRGSLTSLGGNKDPGGGSAQTGGTAAVAGTPAGGRSATGGAGTGGAATGGTMKSTAVIGGQSAIGGTTVMTTVGGATGGTTVGGASGSTGATGGSAAGGTNAVSTAAGGACSTGDPLSGGTQHCYQNGSGSYGPYEWTLWSNTNNTCLTTYSDGAFSVGWNGSGDLMAGVGLAFDGSKTHQELGTFSADFAESKTGSVGGYSFIGIYAVTVDPVATLYIVDDSFLSPAPKPWNAQLVGTLSVDGGIYDIYKGMTLSDGPRPSFINVYSVRQEHRSCGHISVSVHLSKWEDLGMKLGKLDRVQVHTESAGGTGSIDFSTAKVTLE